MKLLRLCSFKTGFAFIVSHNPTSFPVLQSLAIAMRYIKNELLLSEKKALGKNISKIISIKKKKAEKKSHLFVYDRDVP